MSIKQINFFSALWLSLALAFCDIAMCPARAQDTATEMAQKKLAAVNSIPFWAHDATGYHPSLCVRIENLSGNDLTGKLIKMQCRFVDLRLGHVMIARKEQRYELAPNQGINLIFHGPEAYELPIDQYQWPLVECKLMSRIGDVDDSGTEDLLVQKLESVTMTDDEALTALSRGLFHRMTSKRTKPTRVVHKDSPKPEFKKPDYTKPEYKKTEEPMSAKALSLSAQGKTAPTAANDNRTSLVKFSALPKLPGLGSEFLEFEQIYGQPTGASLKEKTWSWIHYAKNDPAIDVFVGAKGSATKADLVVVKIPAELVQQESQVVALAKSMSGKMRTQALEHPHKTVKYQQLSEHGIRRILITTMDAPGYHLTYVTPRGSGTDENNYIIILSRFTGDTVAMMPELIRKAQMMRFLHAALGQVDQD